jgi:FSR family fosmidomycin resistance protein-like MFS transporter
MRAAVRIHVFFPQRFFMNTLNPVSNPWRDDAAVIGLVGIAHASSHFSHLLLPLMFPVFISTFGLSYSELGFLMTVFFVVSGIGQASVGFVVDRLGARPVLFVALLFMAAGCMAVSVADSYVGLMLGAALLGLGNCSFHPVDFTILNQKVSAPRLGYAFSAHGLTGNLGWALAPVFMVSLSAAFDWRAAYVGAALLFAGIFALLFWQRKHLHAEAVNHKQTTSEGGSMAFLKIPVVWWCFGFFLLSTMTLAVVQSFAMSILQALHQVTFEAATFTLTAYMLCAAAGMFLGGFVAARWPYQSDKVVACCMTAGAICMALCGSGWLSAQFTMFILAATGLAIGIGGPSRDMMIKKATPKGATGRVYGMVYSGLDTGFAISPLIFGAFMDHGWYGATLLGAALVLLLSVVLALGVGRRTVHA